MQFTVQAILSAPPTTTNLISSPRAKTERPPMTRTNPRLFHPKNPAVAVAKPNRRRQATTIPSGIPHRPINYSKCAAAHQHRVNTSATSSGGSVCGRAPGSLWPAAAVGFVWTVTILKGALAAPAALSGGSAPGGPIPGGSAHIWRRATFPRGRFAMTHVHTQPLEEIEWLAGEFVAGITWRAWF